MVKLQGPIQLVSIASFGRGRIQCHSKPTIGRRIVYQEFSYSCEIVIFCGFAIKRCRTKILAALSFQAQNMMKHLSYARTWLTTQDTYSRISYPDFRGSAIAANLRPPFPTPYQRNGQQASDHVPIVPKFWIQFKSTDNNSYRWVPSKLFSSQAKILLGFPKYFWRHIISIDIHVQS